MKENWRQRRAMRRTRPGDGRGFRPFRWWQLLGRSVFTLRLAGATGNVVTYAVDIRQWGDRDDGVVRARLYRDGVQHAVAKLPARFIVEDGAIEVDAGGFGVKRCHHVTEAGDDRLLTPHPASAEGRRARLHRNHPALSRGIGLLATAAVLAGVALTLLQLVEPLSSIPPVYELVGRLESPLRLPIAANIALAIAAAMGSTERALRMRSSWLDSLAN
ncbi:hypothetical protein M4I32_01185 [Microbacterium sp. LRZ72]|uniref:hypothetical protein n=1 Tax=Microbacterium sp. LRZ72 TaxID=2942481 RepID=UPI0029AC51F1|nr:hypothetical protein [Microbacterium sp. LRZ72]MDX2375415.1 hypothetical protein [Microbacterium sp. LRZ72]